MSRRPPPPVLDAAHARFLVSGVSVGVAARGAQNIPSITLATGCKVSADRRRVTVFVAPSQSAVLLRNLALQRQIAVVFSQPSTHRTIQLKGEDALVVPVGRADVAALERQVSALALDLGSVGYEESFTRTLWAFDPDDLVAIAFTPTAAYAQTPGPQAGAPLGGGAGA